MFNPNPFAQPVSLWQATLIGPKPAVNACEPALEDMALSISDFEIEGSDDWRLDAVFDGADREEVQRRLAVLAGLHAEVAMTFEQLPEVNWVEAVLQQFPPLQAGRFFVHGSHITEAPPPGSVPLRVDAGGAFGSGEHHTTYGCLLAIDRYLKQHPRPRNALDMGCGTAILGLAVAKAAHCPVLAVDNDAVSVRVAKENIHLNRCREWVSAICGEGCADPLVGKQGPYDLVVANILARPLRMMAASLAGQVAPGGSLVLSGLLETQQTYVLHAYRQQGLSLHSRILREGWATLVLK